MVESFEYAARRIGLPVNSDNGAKAWGGHAARRGGAQFLARSGVEVWRIQALARHSSDAILLYIESTHVDSCSGIASEAVLQRSLDQLREEVSLLRAAQALMPFR